MSIHPLIWGYLLGVLCNWLLTGGYFGRKLARELDNRGSHIAGYYIIAILRWFSWFVALLLLIIYTSIVYRMTMGMSYRKAVDNIYENPENNDHENNN